MQELKLLLFFANTKICVCVHVFKVSRGLLHYLVGFTWKFHGIEMEIVICNVQRAFYRKSNNLEYAFIDTSNEVIMIT